MVEESLNNESPILPSVVLLGIATYNRIEDLGFIESEIFKDPDLIKEYIMSKKYDLKDSMLGLLTALMAKPESNISFSNYNDWSHYLTEDMLNKESDLYKNVLKAVEPYTNYWTPKSTTKIVLFTADNDDIVPSKNSDNLFEYLRSHSSIWENAKAITDADTDFSANNIYIRYHEYGESSLTNIIHEKGAKTFSSKVIEELKTNW